jgi:putative oxidoreductase
MNLSALDKYSDWGPFFLRLVAGGIFVWAGVDKIMGLLGEGAMVTEMLVFAGGAAVALAWVLALVELVGGAMLVLGWNARLAAVPLAFAMLVAVLLTTAGMGFLAMGTWAAWYALAITVYVAVCGSGPKSLDA